MLRRFKGRIEHILMFNVTKFKEPYPQQDGEYYVGYVSANLIKSEVQSINQKYKNVDKKEAKNV